MPTRILLWYRRHLCARRVYIVGETYMCICDVYEIYFLSFLFFLILLLIHNKRRVLPTISPTTLSSEIQINNVSKNTTLL